MPVYIKLKPELTLFISSLSSLMAVMRRLLEMFSK